MLDRLALKLLNLDIKTRLVLWAIFLFIHQFLLVSVVHHLRTLRLWSGLEFALVDNAGMHPVRHICLRRFLDVIPRSRLELRLNHKLV